MPKQAQEKILEGHRQEELITLKWTEIKRQSPYLARLDILEMRKQEREQQPGQEQGSISVEQYEEEERRHYDRQEKKEWKGQEMSAFEDAWREAMLGEERFQDYWAEEESKYNRRYSVEDH